MILSDTDTDFDYVVAAVACSAIDAKVNQDIERLEVYDRILQELRAYKYDKVRKRIMKKHKHALDMLK